MERERFEELVSEALDSLPDSLRSRMANIGVEVRLLADRETLRSVGAKHPMNLLGVYQGVPFDRRGPWYGNVLPDRILIFQQPIEARSRTAAQVRQLVRSVVIHEVGHYFGLDDEELARLERDANRTDKD
ncbi:MAG: metallopeptidase family protein [bacterium]